MEYTRDVIYNVNYGQASKEERFKIFKNLKKQMAKHKTITAVISITFMLMILDIMLISSFVDVLNSFIYKI